MDVANVCNSKQCKPEKTLRIPDGEAKVHTCILIGGGSQLVLSHLVGSSRRPYALLRSLIFNETSWCLSILPYLTGLHLDLNFHDDINVLEHRVVIANIYYLFCGACRRRGTQPATVDPG